VNNDKIKWGHGINNQFVEAMIILDKNGIIQWTSPSIYGLLGYHPDEMKGTEIFRLLYRASPQKVKLLYRELQQHEDMMSEGLKQFSKKNGEKIALYVSLSNLLNHPVINGMLVHLHPFRENEKTNNSSLIQYAVEIEMDARKKVQQEIAAELHDHINPSLIAAKLLLDYSLKNPGTNFCELEKTSGILSSLIEDIRNLSRTVVVEKSYDLELNEALHLLLENFRKCKALRLVLKYDHRLEDLLKYEQKIHILRIIQEQLANIIKHAEAAKALISLQWLNGKLVAITRDNGKGFDLNNRRSGIGLSNMLYRVNALGGNLHINSKPGEGTTIRIVFPMD
jgi:PAS domain S-box-containing protein